MVFNDLKTLALSSLFLFCNVDGVRNESFQKFLIFFPKVKVAFVTMTKFLGFITYAQNLKPFHRNENIESKFQTSSQAILL